MCSISNQHIKADFTYNHVHIVVDTSQKESVFILLYVQIFSKMRYLKFDRFFVWCLHFHMALGFNGNIPEVDGSLCSERSLC